MRISTFASSWFFVFAALCGAQTGTPIEDEWHVVLIEGHEAGYMHAVSAPAEAGDGLVTTSMDMVFVMRRMGADIRIETNITYTEAESGQLVALRQSMSQGQGAATVWDGVVHGDELVFTMQTAGPTRESSIDWPDDVPGPRELERRLQATGFEPRATFTVMGFDYSLGDTFETIVKVVGDENLEVDGEQVRLHKIESKPASLPTVYSWVDDRGHALKTSTDMNGMFLIETQRADRERVARFIDGDSEDVEGVEVFLQMTITANVRLPRPRSLDAITYRVRPKIVNDAAAELPALTDERQQFTFDPESGEWILQVRVVVPGTEVRQTVPLSADEAPPELLEFLEPNAMLQSDAPEIIELARTTVGDEVNPWHAAVALERAVHDHINEKTMDVAFASALDVCRSGEGDCSEHAVLLAALCRASGIPARVAMGIVYVGGIFGGHAWTEVWIDGTWYAIDGTIARGSVDPTHIRFATMSLQGGSIGKGLMDVMRGLGGLDLEILQLERDGNITRVSGAGAVTDAEVRDGRYVDLVAGVSFDIPAGWNVRTNRPAILEMSNAFEVARISSDTTDDVIVIMSREVGVANQRFRAQRGIARDTPHLAGHVTTSRRGGRVFSTLVGDISYEVMTRTTTEDGLLAFESIVNSLTIE